MNLPGPGIRKAIGNLPQVSVEWEPGCGGSGPDARMVSPDRLKKTLSVSCPLLLLALACGGGPSAAPGVTGRWKGELSLDGVSLLLEAELSEADSGLRGTLDIPQQQARGIELIRVSRNADSLEFTMPSVMGPARFRGVVRGDTLLGAFEQGDYAGSFRLVRFTEPVSPGLPPGEEVTITGEDCVLAGTLTLPAGPPPHPCVLLLSGSGLQDRDEYVMGFPVFAELEALLVPEGIAVLRCDDRGVGGSRGGMEGYGDSLLLHDAGLMLDHLRGDPRISLDRIGLLGHSEGSTTAFMLAAARPEAVAFVVSMAGPAIDGYHLVLDQVEILSTMQGLSAEAVAGKLEAQTVIMDDVLRGGDLSRSDSVLRAQLDGELQSLDDAERAAVGDPEVYLDQSVAATMVTLRSPWFARFLRVDPAEAIRRVECPVLVLYGGLDIQVSDEANLEAMQLALARSRDHEILLIEGANHLFQEAVTGSLEEYALLEPHFIGEFSDILTAWITARSGLD